MNASTEKLRVPTFDLQKHHSKVKMPTEFDLKDLSRKYHVFPLKVIQQGNKRRLLLAMRDTKQQQAIYDVEFRASMTVIPVLADDIDIQWLIQKHYYGRPLTPTPSSKPREVTHDLFEQLAITTDAQKRPDWINESIEIYISDFPVEDDKK